MIRTKSLAAAAAGALASVLALAPAPAHANHNGPSSPVVGYIQIIHNAPNAPTYALFGDLATPNWSCGWSSTAPGPTAVTCNPTSLLPALVFHCDVLHADIQGLSMTARARTSMDCNGDNVWEAQTAFIGGPVYDFVWAQSTATVTSFTCRVDGNQIPAPTPSYRAGCGDPGLVHLH